MEMKEVGFNYYAINLGIVYNIVRIRNPTDLGSAGNPGISDWSRIGNLLIPSTLKQKQG